MRVLHLVDALALNGRTVLLQEFVRHAGPSVEHLIVTLRHSGGLARRFTEMGVEVHGLRLYAPFRGLHQKKATALRALRFQADACLCWSGDANLVSTLPRLLGIPAIWTIHNSIDRWKDTATRWAVRCSALLSSFVPARIICSSRKSYEIYRNIHRYADKKLTVISNGVDVLKFKPDETARERVRRELGVPAGSFVVSTAAWMRASKRGSEADEKDLETLLKAASIVCRQKNDVFFLLFGVNLTYNNEQLVGWLKDYGLQANTRLLGFQDDVAALFAASDVFSMSSTSESSPLALLEAMSSGAIPVCTDAGDTRAVVGSAGWVVPPKDSEGMAAAILHIAGLSESQRSEYARRAVEMINSSYRIEHLVRRYVDVVRSSCRPSSRSDRRS